jgi:predicted dehydrogenase
VDPMRVIQVGVGGFGRLWLQSIKQLQSVRIVALVDTVEDHLIEAKNILGDGSVPIFQSHEQAFREVEADLALLITPPPTRYRLTRDALQAGMHVIMEKPVASTYAEALELRHMTKGYDKIVAVNQNYRWSPQIQAMKTAVAAGMIGNVEIVEWQFERNLMTHRESQVGWRKDRAEPLLTELSIHHFDLMRYLLDAQPQAMFAKSFNPSWNRAAGNTTASAIIEFSAGIHANYFATSVNRGTDTTWTGNVRLVGSAGAVGLRDMHVYHVSEDGVAHPLAIPVLKYTAVDYTVDEFVQAIKENRQPATHIDDNLVSFSMVGAAIESSNTGAIVRLDTGYYKAY